MLRNLAMNGLIYKYNNSNSKLYGFSKKVLYFFERTDGPFILACLVFCASALIVAIFVQEGLPPDENWHIGVIKYYAANTLLPFIADQSDSFVLGDLTRLSHYLYHYLFSFYYRLLEVFDVNNYVFLLRLPNIFLALGSLVTLKKIAERLNINKLAANLGTLFVAGVPMFVFLSGSVNYDNMAILFALLITLYTLKLSSDPEKVRTYIMLAVLWSAGVLVKYVLLPVVAASFLVALYYLFRSRKKIYKELRKIDINASFLIVLVFAVLFSGLAIERYGYNYLEYGAPRAKCDEIHEFNQCMERGIFARSQRLNQNPPETEERVSLPVYLTTWSSTMFKRTFNVFGHEQYESNLITYYSALSIVLLMIIAIVRKVSKRDLMKYAIPSLLFLVYFIALVNKNHGTYINRNNITLAVQGRYLFIVLFPVLLIGMNYITQLLNNRYIKLLIISLIVPASIYNGTVGLFTGLDNYWMK